MRRTASILLAVSLMTSFLCGCQKTAPAQVSCADVIDAYESAGYDVFHKETSGTDDVYTCYMTVHNAQTDDDIYFYFFSTAEEAEVYAKERRWNVVLWFYSLVLTEPTWLTTKTYGNIEYEYDNKEMAQPFLALTD